MTYTLTFKQLGKDDIPSAGGKGANLGEMTRAGFPVPPGFVLTTEAYDAFVQEHGIQQQIIDLASQVSADDPQSSEAASAKIKQLFLAAGNVPNIVAALLSAYSEVQEGAVAVRSSATAEDLPNASFAGQQETYLNVRGEAALLEAVKKCWASLWTARAIAYRLRQGIDPAAVSLAVVAQKQIAADVSGVAFSLNPQNNCYDEAVINSNFGLGETVVSGQVTPDTFVVDTVKQQILEKSIAAKSHALVGKADGGIEEQRIEDPNTPSLTDEQALAIGELVARVADHYGVPMDIEWAYQDGTLYLLQARPITTYLPLFPEMMTQRGERKKLYLDLIVLSQGFSEPMSVLGLDIWAQMLQAAKGAQLPRGEEGLVWDIHGRQYMALSNMMKTGGGIMKRIMSSYDTPTRKTLEGANLSEYLPEGTPEGTKGYLLNVGKTVLRMLPDMWNGYFHPEKAREQYLATSEEVWRYLKEELPASDEPFAVQVEKSLGGFGELVKSAGALIAPAYARWRLGRMFKHEEAGDLLVALNMDLPGNPTSEMGHLMVRVASHPEFRKTETAAEFTKNLDEKRYSPEFLEIYHDYLDRFGCRGMKEIDIASPRTYENPDQLFLQLKQIDPESNAITTVKERSEAAYNHLLAQAKRMGQEGKFVKFARIQREMAGYREHPKYIYVVAVDVLRRRALKLGENFVAQGRLEHASQIFELHIDEVTQAEKDPDLALFPLIERNTASYRAVEHIQDWPRIIDSRGKTLRAKRDNQDGLEGDPISPGVITGKAKVLHSPYEKPLEKGEILVTKATEPSWTPIFINAAGVVLEVGGPLQHGAIIAREYGIPCVSGVDGATAAIKDGDMLEVDGSNGVVRIIEVNAA